MAIREQRRRTLLAMDRAPGAHVGRVRPRRGRGGSRPAAGRVLRLHGQPAGHHGRRRHPYDHPLGHGLAGERSAQETASRRNTDTRKVSTVTLFRVVALFVGVNESRNPLRDRRLTMSGLKVSKWFGKRSFHSLLQVFRLFHCGT